MAYDAVGTFRPSLDACVAPGCLWTDPAGSTLAKRQNHPHETRAFSSSKMAQLEDMSSREVVEWHAELSMYNMIASRPAYPCCHRILGDIPLPQAS